MNANRPGPNPAASADPTRVAPDLEPATVLPLVEEDVQVSKHKVVTGRVRVRTLVDTSEHLVRQDLDTEHVTLSRVAIDRYVDVAPEIRTEGDVTIIPVLEEVVVVETKLILREEVHIRRTLTRETVEQPVTLRQQRVVVEEEGGHSP